jgi:SAM-dependent methyltransferase
VSAVNPYAYDEVFFASIERGSRRSAEVLVPMVVRSIAPRSVLDVGCGRGAWLAVWHVNGVPGHGIDGASAKARTLLVPEEDFTAVDLARPFALARRFDLVQCLEVAEHLPPESAPALVASLCAHGDVVLFSAAPPGQGGEHHVNERPYAYWRGLFAVHGYALFDPYRDELVGDLRVEPWYRFNTFVYARNPQAVRSIASSFVSPDDEPRDVAPWFYRLRRRVLGLLPVPAITAVAQLKKHVVVRMLRTRSSTPNR